MIELGQLPYGLVLLADPDDRSAWVRAGSTLIRPREMKHWIGGQKIREAVMRIAKDRDDFCRREGIPGKADIRLSAALDASFSMNPEIEKRPRRYPFEVVT